MMNPKKIKTFCRIVSQAHAYGMLNKQQSKTLIGQAKHGELEAAKHGLQTIIGR